VRRTKIVCTIGPATASEEKLRQIIEAGADVMRLNFSHGTDAEHRETAQRIRSVAAALGKPIAILQDLPGPKIRLGTFGEGVIQLSSGDRFTITTAEVCGDQQRVSVNYPQLADEVQPGQTLLLDDGTVELKIERITSPEIQCRVVVGGALSSHKGVAVPRGTLSVSAFTEQDRVHLLSGLEMGVDLVALSFVRSPADISAARTFLEAQQAELPLMAKIEKPEALDVFDELLAVVDAVMIARGDLGVEIPPAEVPLVQKDLIPKAMRVAKPVVTATQMLRSMVDSPHPTRAEATDVANAVLDGTDAVMLSEESAVGAYPVEAVRVLAQIATAAEQRLIAQRAAAILSWQQNLGTSAAIGHAACLLAYEAGATAIICCTRTGRTAQLVAKYRPATPIIAVCRHEVTVRRLMLTWGITPVFANDFESLDAMINAACEAARSTALVASGDRVVIVGGAPSAPPGRTDFLRVATLA
jgi:pyruvate kinase